MVDDISPLLGVMMQSEKRHARMPRQASSPLARRQCGDSPFTLSNGWLIYRGFGGTGVLQDGWG